MSAVFNIKGKGQNMAGTYGVGEMKKAFGALAQAMNVISQALSGSLFALFGLVTPLQALQGIDFALLGKEAGELDSADRAEVEVAFKGNLNLVNKTAQTKILAATDILEEAIATATEALSVVNSGLSLVNRTKALLGI